MKVFDAHCHIYPAKIAQKAAAATATFYDNLGETYDGTVQTLFAEGAGIDRFLVQSVATKPEQVGTSTSLLPQRLRSFQTACTASVRCIRKAGH